MHKLILVFVYKSLRSEIGERVKIRGSNVAGQKNSLNISYGVKTII